MLKKALLHQATINVGTIGHVAHGKSTVVRAITGIQTVRFKDELERNITIKLGYANAKLFRCKNIHCPRPGCFRSTNSYRKSKPFCNQCLYNMDLIHHISFVDCPGHEILMATMINGASIMDAALLIIASNEKCPQPQTTEHVAAAKIMKMKDLIIIQNKVDLVTKEKALKNYHDIQTFKKHANLKDSNVVPISAQKNLNIDILLEILYKKIEFPFRFLLSNPYFLIVRSFDINKPGCKIKNLSGGVVGGSVITGIFFKNQKIEIRPGITTKNKRGQIICYPIKSIIHSMNAEKNDLKYVFPGGLVGIGTEIDPNLTRADRLSGQLLGSFNSLPHVYNNIFVLFKLFKRLLGISNQTLEIKPLILNEILMVNTGSSSTGGKIIKKKKNLMMLFLTTPICCKLESRLALSRRVQKHWRLIGWGIIKRGKKCIISIV